MTLSPIGEIGTMRRRAFITACTTGTMALLAGCNDQTDPPSIDLTVRNESDQQVTIDVFFTDKNRETIYSTRYSLDSNKVDESHSFAGDPVWVYTVVNESLADVSEFTGEPCQGTQDTRVGILYNDKISVDFPC